MDLKTALSQFFKGEILDDEETLTKFSKDASLFEIKPTLVLSPKDSADIEKLIEFINKHPEAKLSLTPRSAGTCMAGGSINDSLILDMTKYFNQVLKVGEDFALTQPGVYYRDFEVETLKKDLILPCYTASREINTVGGMVGNNSAGEKTLSYGQTIDYVNSLKVILADGKEYEVKPLSKTELSKKIKQKDFEGNIYKKVYELIEDNYEKILSAKPQVSKNSMGYNLWDVWDKKTFDLSKLITGSQGTLGVVSEINFKLVKPKKYSNIVVMFLYNIDHLGEVVNKVLAHNPESFESYDDKTLQFAIRFWMEVLKVLKPQNILQMAIQFIPEVLMTMRYGFPKLILLAEFTGDNLDEIQKKCSDTISDIKPFNIRCRVANDQEDDGRKYWVVRRESFALFRRHAGKKHTAPFIDDIIVPPSVMPEFLPKLQAILKPYEKKFIYTIAGHIGNGNLHIIPLIDITDKETRAMIPEAAEKVYKLVLEYKGSIAAEHNDGLIRGPYLPEMYGEDIYQLFKEVKEIFDPKNIFNPHKKTDATFEYSLKHLAKSN